MDKTKEGITAAAPGENLPGQKPDREIIREHRRQGKADGARFLKEKRACSNAEETRAFRRKWRQHRKALRDEMKSAPPAKQAAIRQEMKAFRRRIHRGRRIARTAIALMLLVCLILLGTPGAVMLWRVNRSQKLTNSGQEVEIARATGYALASQICDEGFVLLKNDEGFLPLGEEKKLNLFGDDAYALAGGSTAPGAGALYDALKAQGIECNGELFDFYTQNKAKSLQERLSTLIQPKKDSGDWRMPENITIKSAREYSDTALIVLSAASEKGKDIPLSALQPMTDGTVRAKLIDTVCKEFEHVILVINSGNVMELGFTEDYESIDAVLWVGLPGSQGCSELAKVLTGEVNPSGRCVDTWPVNLSTLPAMACETGYYANVSGLHATEYAEGIYTGYRYYETRYGGDEDAYRKEVLYPFGYGLSYTSFTEELTDLTEKDGVLTASVTVKNTGDAAGKDVVQIYCMPPYYEDRGIEKAAISLAGFAKTGELAPGGEETLDISLPLQSLASWAEAEGCYVLESGEYKIAAGRDVHAALTAEDSRIYTLEEEALFREDEKTGTALQSRLGFAKGEMTPLSRSRWEETYPTAEKRLIASNALKQTLSEYEKNPGLFADRTAEPTYGAGNGISFESLKGLAYTDANWEAFLDQLTLKEMIRLAGNGAYHTEALKRLNVPGELILGESSGLKAWKRGTLSAVPYPAEVVTGATWNTDLAAKLGQAVAAEAKAYGIDGWYAPNAGLHRTPSGADNANCFSEDPLLTGMMVAKEVERVQDAGILAIVQGFACADAEAAAENTCVYVSEQALREIWLRPFELAVKEGGADGIAASPARLGVEWCGASPALLQDVLRGEWGFEGIITTEDAPGMWMDASLAVKRGADLMADRGWRGSEGVLWLAYYRDRAGTAWAVRECAHRILYAVVNGVE